MTGTGNVEPGVVTQSRSLYTPLSQPQLERTTDMDCRVLAVPASATSSPKLVVAFDSNARLVTLPVTLLGMELYTAFVNGPGPAKAVEETSPTISRAVIAAIRRFIKEPREACGAQSVAGPHSERGSSEAPSRPGPPSGP